MDGLGLGEPPTLAGVPARLVPPPASATNGPISHPDWTPPISVAGKVEVPFAALYSLEQTAITLADACPPPTASSATEAVTAKPKIRMRIESPRDWQLSATHDFAHRGHS